MRVRKLQGMVPAVLTAPMCTHVALLVLQHGLRDRERGLRPGNEGGAGRKHHRRCARVGLGFKNIPKTSQRPRVLCSVLFFAKRAVWSRGWLVLTASVCHYHRCHTRAYPCANPGAYQKRRRNTPLSRLSCPCDCHTMRLSNGCYIAVAKQRDAFMWCMCHTWSVYAIGKCVPVFHHAWLQILRGRKGD